MGFIKYLIVTPGKHDIVQTTVRLVDTVLSGIHTILRVGVPGECIRIYDLVRESASDDKCILEKSQRMVSAELQK